MKIAETAPRPAGAILPGSDFADAWQLDGLPPDDAATIAARAFGAAPRWVDALLALRNLMVGPFGLKTGKEHAPKDKALVGIFPVISERPDQIVLGLDDRHLDFRVVVDVVPVQGRTIAATATTYVRTHNRFGRLYLMVVKPFHRVIVPAMLRRAVVSG